MSNFGKSFEKELGRNTGKWVSNVIFGDGHATPYRRAESRRQEKLDQQRIQEENFHQQRLTQIRLDDKIRQKEQLLAIDTAVIQNINYLSSIKIPNSVEEITDLLSELTIQIKTNKWRYNNEEGKIRNKYNEALLEKYNQILIRFRSIAPNHHQIKYFEKNIKDFKKKRFIKKNIIMLLIAFFIFSVLCVFLITEGLFTIVFGSIALVTIAICGYKYYKLNTQNTKNKIPNIRYVQDEKNNNSDKIIILKKNIIEESVFLDLNENNRIENKLSEIWNKYNAKVSSQIINRKPIFSADGVIDSVLFIGINPSYNPSDNDSFIKSSDQNSLMYGSFYQLSNAPEYFKALEFFANKLHKGYTHINLLYAREDNRDLLLNADHNFIREQLELTYETILKIKPVVIFFFSDYCKDLIFGEDRWVNPNSESNGSYILKGTNFPVFFTDDITSMTELEQMELINKIKDTLT
ncbi:hypothetical protein [Myroides odoratimimus]|uniref:TIR domain-containing protein n=1 Tax=Myroides odoratimimus CIP 101113 TaxID=883154 RepID=A0AAV3F0J0_9FLAO|nr:hypothetical protein [Myroides odoratimimus]EHO07928.1 hypothetical protein HMPREF9715_02794 [Myroides odoratimimus CIP 101113]